MGLIYNGRKKKQFFLYIAAVPLLLLMALYVPLSVRFIEGLIPMDKCPLPHEYPLHPGNHVDNSLDLWSRTDVQTCTYWGAPIIWDGMFDPEYYDDFYRKQNITVALTVFAVGRYLDLYLEKFLTSAEQHFMFGQRVIYYVFTDSPEKVPKIKMAAFRTLLTFRVEKYSRWQDVSMLRMKMISDIIDSHVRHHAQYIFCLDVDQTFVGRFGTEALGDMVALLHSFYYRRPKFFYTYDQNPKSTAYIKTGDMYYHAAVFGGTWQRVKNLTQICYDGIMQDKMNHVEALWHDESHLNKYFLLYKPTKLLSPEYCWAEYIGYRSDIHVHRLVWAEKNYKFVRQ
ncbi:alpha-1,3-galactosyltransferase 2-like isoform X1 [Polypterus senegalus]|uniref:alpha-1,3-galactosyltransferase 2-like isoform X1 n=2 Tax=Polypterus senegalus TaxID=55291 RepID=UPI0019636B3E|nr:alpha-1,3-galactosyltransferase 2-like isoform X1 [Polypterus senegalus]